MSGFFNTLAEIALTMSVVILLLLLLGPLLSRRYSIRWRYWAWLAVSVRMLLPVNFSLPEAPVRLEPPPDRVVWTAPAPAPSPAAVPSAPPAASPLPAPEATVPSQETAQAAPAPARSLTLSQVLPWVWGSGAVLLLLWHLVGWLRFQAYVRRWARPAEPEARAEAVRQAEALGISAPVSLLRCPGVADPMMTGLFRPTVLLPEEGPSAGDLRFVLRHELTHFRRRDIPYKVLLLCANIVYWFDPLVWVMLRAAEGDMERSCDSDVVKGLPQEERARYGQVILDAARTGTHLTKGASS